jgi:hypothetical protein
VIRLAISYGEANDSAVSILIAANASRVIVRIKPFFFALYNTVSAVFAFPHRSTTCLREKHAIGQTAHDNPSLF